MSDLSIKFSWWYFNQNLLVQLGEVILFSPYSLFNIFCRTTKMKIFYGFVSYQYQNINTYSAIKWYKISYNLVIFILRKSEINRNNQKAIMTHVK